MNNVSNIVWRVARDMRACGDMLQRNENDRDDVRRRLHEQGVRSYTIDAAGSGRLYAFHTETIYELEFAAVANVSEGLRVQVNGFTLDPSRDWSVVGYFAVGAGR